MAALVPLTFLASVSVSAPLHPSVFFCKTRIRGRHFMLKLCIFTVALQHVVLASEALILEAKNVYYIYKIQYQHVNCIFYSLYFPDADKYVL